MIAALRDGWSSFWFRPAPPLGLLAARTLLCANALWIVLSRPDLADLAGWPPELWAGVSTGLRLRYLIPRAAPLLEHAGYAALVLALSLALCGIAPRLSSFAAAAFLYHFAPFEQILVTQTGPYQGGLTLPTVGLFILSFAPPARRASAPAPEYRWPVALLRLLLAFSYLFAGLAKLTLTGLSWMSAKNIEATALVVMTYEARPAWAHWLVDHPGNARLFGTWVVAFEIVFISAVFSRTAARILAPLAGVFHLSVLRTFGISFLNAPLLLLFVDWDALQAWRERRGTEAGRRRSDGV